MAHTHLLSACVFCLLCLTHIRCSDQFDNENVGNPPNRDESAANDSSGWRPEKNKHTSDFFEKVLNSSYSESSTHKNDALSKETKQQRRNRPNRNNAVPVIIEDIYVDKLYSKYQNSNKSLDLDGLKRMLSELGLQRAHEPKEIVNNTKESGCLQAEKIVASLGEENEPNDNSISRKGLLKLCPLLLYHAVEPEHCNDASENETDKSTLTTWLYASLSVTVISLCGLFGVFVIPVMGRSFYQPMLQFLVALAVGTLCGDALLHLLPHALVPHTNHEGSEHTNHKGGGHEHDHSAAILKGLAVLLGLIFFFFTEKILMLGSEWRKRQQRSRRVQGHSHVQILNGNNPEHTDEKMCKHKYSSYPYCYPDIKSNVDGHEHTEAGAVSDELIKDECGKKAGEYDVIVREHTTSHHGHSHSHGHVHSAPGSLSSVAWMVILGDGLHNFTDGMAIGAAFSDNLAGGFSTAVAVFCHELPHELGDFAVLLKTGMSAKQAVFYNLISSVLCYGGMILGMFVGGSPEASSWVFAVSAGMFLYIALVDMFPEMTSSHSTMKTTCCQFCMQGMGMLVGVGIMLVIAYYEDHLLSLFN